MSASLISNSLFYKIHNISYVLNKYSKFPAAFNADDHCREVSTRLAQHHMALPFRGSSLPEKSVSRPEGRGEAAPKVWGENKGRAELRKEELLLD